MRQELTALVYDLLVRALLFLLFRKFFIIIYFVFCYSHAVTAFLTDFRGTIVSLLSFVCLRPKKKTRDSYNGVKKIRVGR